MKLVKLLIILLLIVIPTTLANATVTLNKDSLLTGETLTITVTPGTNGILKYLYFYDSNNVLQDTKKFNCKGSVCYVPKTLDYVIPSTWSGLYYVAIYDYDINDYIKTYFTVLRPENIALGISNELSSGVTWNILTLPVINYPAIGNNGIGTSFYYVDISSNGPKVDLYIKADGDLISGFDVILLQNERYNYDFLSTVPTSTRISLTTDYQLVERNLRNGDRIYFKFYLDVPSSQSPGLYTNYIDFKITVRGPGA